MTKSISLAAGVVFSLTALAAPPVYGQSSMYAKALDRFDANRDGKIFRGEVPDGLYRGMFDRMVEQYKLDAAKTYTRAELETILGATTPSGANSSASPSRRDDPRRGERGRPAPRSTAGSGGKTYRTLADLPGEYQAYDKDGDGQVGLYEWPRNRLADFQALDKNDDGFLTLSEVKKPGPPPEEPKKEAQPDAR
jgi:Ca2+-binding EF-hand superfamily protein